MSKRARFRANLKKSIKPPSVFGVQKPKISTPQKNVGQSVYPNVRIIRAALNRTIDKDRRFTNALPVNFDKIDCQIRTCMELIGDFHHYGTPYTINRSKKNWERARAIIDKTIGIGRIPSEEDALMEYSILTEFQKSMRDRGAFRVLANYKPANEMGFPVLVVDFIDPYHLLFPGDDGNNKFKNILSRSYTASLNDHFYNRLKKELFID